MSLIFQSLQKLKSDLSCAPSGSDDAAPQQNPAQTKSCFRFRSTLICFAVVLVLGCGTVYAVQVLKQRVGDQQGQVVQNRRHAISPNKTSVLETATEPQQHIQHLDAPQPEEKKAPETLARFYPPEQKRAVEVMPSATKVPDQSLQQFAGTESAKPESLGSSAVPAPLPMGGKRQPPDVEGHSVHDAAMEAAEQARRAALAKSARIARLVRKIEQAMAGGSHAGNPQALLDQLARIKGENNSYVMKMRAYWNFKRGHYDAAETDLKKVIAVNPDDLEAGINLALIEIHGERHSEAMIRLKHLRNIYPDQPLVADLIKRLK